ncbi:MAG TPA: 2Fe-2S iron-sulfur cluster-binding protein, partial [Burkholderiales bacterium]|nr:2Fe-2S iron-sulfur cluster-binding protein [Burkholderiales bacterium]
MTQPFRTPAGGRIDRAQPLDFSFDGRTWSGYRGDTLASALLANGVHLVARSFKYHRPRGILSAGAEEPNALVQLGRGARTEPNLRATQIELYAGLCAASQNRWPSLRFDLGAVSGRLSALLPAGFYYKTFMRPAGWWPGYEGLIRRAAGVGRAPGLPDPDRYDARHEHCDVLVVGGGPAGLSAALAAGRSGARVMVADEQLEFGGQLLDERGDDGTVPFAGTALAELASLPRVRLLTRTTIAGYYDHNFLVGVERVTDHLGPGPHGATPRQRLWKIRARQVVLATGALERPLVFADNDRPGIMLAGAVRAYLNRFGVRCGTRAVVVAGTDEACRSALDLADAGIDVAAVVRLRGAADERLAQALRGRGIELLDSPRVIAAVGTKRVEALAVAASEGGPVREIACDLVCMSAGWAPNVSLFSQSRGTLRYDAALAAYVPGRSAQAERSAGACAGALTLAQCLNGGYAAGADAARAAGFAVDRGEPHPGGVAPRAPGDAPPQAPDRYARPGRSFVDFYNDVTVADVELAAREGYAAVEHLKRYTTLGMGPDQGKTANLNALALLAGLRGVGIPELGHTTFRPPYTPITLGAI